MSFGVWHCSTGRERAALFYGLACGRAHRSSSSMFYSNCQYQNKIIKILKIFCNNFTVIILQSFLSISLTQSYLAHEERLQPCFAGRRATEYFLPRETWLRKHWLDSKFGAEGPITNGWCSSVGEQRTHRRYQSNSYIGGQGELRQRCTFRRRLEKSETAGNSSCLLRNYFKLRQINPRS